MYIIEFERSKRKLRGGTIPVPGVLVSIRRTIPGMQSQTDLLAERFLDGTDALIFDGVAEHGVILIQEGVPPERQGTKK